MFVLHFPGNFMLLQSDVFSFIVNPHLDTLQTSSNSQFIEQIIVPLRRGAHCEDRSCRKRHEHKSPDFEVFCEKSKHFIQPPILGGFGRAMRAPTKGLDKSEFTFSEHTKEEGEARRGGRPTGLYALYYRRAGKASGSQNHTELPLPLPTGRRVPGNVQRSPQTA